MPTTGGKPIRRRVALLLAIAALAWPATNPGVAAADRPELAPAASVAPSASPAQAVVAGPSPAAPAPRPARAPQMR